MNHKPLLILIVLLLISLVGASAWQNPSQAAPLSDSVNAVQQAKLTASDGYYYDTFGRSTAIHQDTAVVTFFNDRYPYPSGAYVYYRNLGGFQAWGQKVKLVSSDPNTQNHFGDSLSIYADTIAIGASTTTIGGNAAQGAAYIFERSAGGADAWGQVKKLTAGDGAASDNFADSLALAGDTLVVGAPYSNGNLDSGAVYVFSRNQGGANNWGLVTKLVSSDAANGDRFGDSVAIDGDTIVVAAPGKVTRTGAAYIFDRNMGGNDAWGEVRKIVASDGAPEVEFAYSVSISGDTVVCGAPMADAIYIYQRHAGGVDQWGQVKVNSAPSNATDSRFGESVAIDQDVVLVGASISNVGGDYLAGEAYVFLRDQDGPDAWGQAGRFNAADPEGGAFFGIDLALDEGTASIGAFRADINGVEDQGAAYIFSLDHGSLRDSILQVDRPTARPIETITYTISLVNSSQAEVAGASLSNVLPAHLAYVAGSLTASQGQALYQSGEITWSGIIAAQETVTITFAVTIDSTVSLNQALTNAIQIQGGGQVYYRKASVLVLPYQTCIPLIHKPCRPLIFDDFSNPASGWPTGDTGNSLFEYKDGEYRILVRPTYWGAGAYSSFQATEYALTVDVRNPNATWGSYGLAFGISQDWGSFFGFEIFPDGWFQYYYSFGTGYILIKEGYSSAINQGSGSNHLKVYHQGSLTELYANGQLLHQDPNHGSNNPYLGVMAFTANQSNLDIRYDNFTVYSSRCTPYGAAPEPLSAWRVASGPQFLDAPAKLDPALRPRHSLPAR
jgi:uncharacterized repeat protein (TIGR01451 family)